MKTKRFLLFLLVIALVLLPCLAAADGDGSGDECVEGGSHDWQYFCYADCTSGGWAFYQCTKCHIDRDEVWVEALGHDWSAWITRQEATCTAGGTEYRQCSRCGEAETRNTEPLGHAWDNGIVTTAPTCAAEGVKTFTCMRCGATRTESIPKTGHTPVSVPGKAATCTEAGLTEGSKCSTCGAVLKAQESIPAKGHSWDGGRVTQEATCTAEGVKTFTCSNCGATRTDTFPAKGHTPAAVPGRAATCTEAGLTEGSQCSACGAVLTAQQEIPALGHSWDSGVITKEPQGFTPGEKTFTCTRCGASFYKPVDPTASVFNGMSNAIPDFSGGVWLMNNPVVPLHIVTQPKGGVVPNGGEEPLELFVEAAGGEGAYTYHWYREPVFALASTSALGEIVASQGTAIAATVQATQNSNLSGLSELQQAWWKQHNLPGVTVTKPTATTAAEAMTTQPFSPSTVYIGQSDTPYCYVKIANNRYWCVVYDEAGHHVTSDKVEVHNWLHIVRQPESTNIYGRDRVALYCVAAGGSSPDQQLYNWFDTAGNLLSDESTYMASKEGEYYCQVWDFGSDEMVESVKAQVYSEEFDTSPTIILQPEGMELEPREDGKYSFSLFCQAITFDGGSEDLKYEWYYKKIQADRTFVGEGAIIDAHEPGHYICVVTDTRSGGYVESEDAFVNVGLTIKDIAFVDHGGYYNIDYTICGGSKPYFVTVYERRIVDIKDNGNYKYAERTIWREHDEEEGWQDGPYAETSYIWYHPVNGQYVPETHELYFQIFVVDDIGQVVHTDYFRCGYGGNIVMEGEN